MYANHTLRGAGQLRVCAAVACLWAAAFSPGFVAEGRAANLEPALEKSPEAIIPLDEDVSGVDLNAGQEPVIVAPSGEAVPLILPAVVDLDTTRDVRALDCQDAGGYVTTFGFSNVFRGNIYSVNQARVLKEFSMQLNVAQSNRTLHFYVYERNTTDGKYYRLLEQPRIFPTGGLGMYSSGSITVNMATLPGKFYLIGVAWNSPAITFGLDTVTYPSTTSWGTIEGNSGLNAAPPLATPITASLNRNGAYDQQLCFESLPGACCSGVSCSVVQRADCNGQFSEEGNTCADVSCPLPEAACCFDTKCTVATEFLCDQLGGTWNTNGVLNRDRGATPGDWDGNGCIDLDDDFLAFADCLTNGGPVVAPSPICADAFDFVPTNGLVDLGDFAAFQLLTIDSNGCPPAAGGDGDWDGNGCIDRDDDFVEMANCLGNGGPEVAASQICADHFDFAPPDGFVDLKDFAAFQLLHIDPGLCGDAEGPCNPNPCVPPPGACCYMNGDCDNPVTEAECADCDRSIWHAGLTCDDVVCGPLGCCIANCQVTPGPGSGQVGACPGVQWCQGLECGEANCQTGFCPAIGGCCMPDGNCVEPETQASCEGLGGTFVGETDRCCNAECPQPEACCNTNGACTDELTAACIENGGTHQGEGSTCALVNCPEVAQACCLPNGDCTDLLPSDCTDQNGNPLGFDTVCPTTTGTQACCFTNGFCLNLDVDDCACAEGTPQGASTTCASIGECLGACCLTSTCFENQAEDDCTEVPSFQCWVGGRSCAACSDPELCPP